MVHLTAQWLKNPLASVVETRLDTTQRAAGDDNDKVRSGLKHKLTQLSLLQSLACKDQGILVSSIVSTSNIKAYLAHKDQEVEMRARSKSRQVFIQRGAVHRPGIR
jgi:hypothetical protein